MVNYIIEATQAKKEGSKLLLSIMNACKMQGQIPINNMFQPVNTSKPINLL